MLAAMVFLFSTPGVLFVSTFSRQFAQSVLLQDCIGELLVFEGVVLSIIDKVCYLTPILLWKTCVGNCNGNELKKPCDELAKSERQLAMLSVVFAIGQSSGFSLWS